MSEPIHIISLGAGVQSSTMALMAAKGEITPMPSAAIFADVVDSEPASVGAWLNDLEKLLPFPLHRVSKGSLYRDILDACSPKQSRVASIPMHTAGESDGILWRQCTHEYKIAPLLKKTKEIRGAQEAIVWIGISTDEVSRCKDSKVKGVTHRWPLIDAGMSRHDCLNWMRKNGYPQPPRSSCFFCPYHSNAEWRRLKDEEPASFDAAMRLDVIMRQSLPNVKSKAYLHPSRKPLHEVDFSTEEERGQINMFNNDCTGMCGV